MLIHASLFTHTPRLNMWNVFWCEPEFPARSHYVLWSVSGCDSGLSHGLTCSPGPRRSHFTIYLSDSSCSSWGNNTAERNLRAMSANWCKSMSFVINQQPRYGLKNRKWNTRLQVWSTVYSSCLMVVLKIRDILTAFTKKRWVNAGTTLDEWATNMPKVSVGATPDPYPHSLPAFLYIHFNVLWNKGRNIKNKSSLCWKKCD